jgi:hypothetical protein
VSANEQDQQAILSMLIARAESRIDGQIQGNDSLDTKAMGILGLDAAVIALMVAVHDSVGRFWWIPTAGLGVAAVLLLYVVWLRKYDIGPDVRDFYDRQGGGTALAAKRQMLSELLAAIDSNDARLPRKSSAFKLGFAVFLVSLLGCLLPALVGR